ncbi:MAG: VacJ family lipoprotein [Pseudomonadota bacterium]|nr:VacJ family lipoprotein [Pseudomonadota bacterium]
MLKSLVGQHLASVVMKQCKLGAVIVLGSLSFGKVALANENVDPYESFNRGVWKFNDYADRYVMKPVAQAYKAVTPDILERGIANVFSNIGNIPTAANNLLQGKPLKAGQDITRFIFNATFGGFGLYDIATDIGLPAHQEDLGQTLGVWGMSQGPYIVLPLLGPSSVRDTVAYGIELSQLNYPYDDIEPDSSRNATVALNVVNLRAQLLALDNIAPGDDYLFFRDAYLQRREAMVRDGKTDPEAEDDFLNEDW